MTHEQIVTRYAEAILSRMEKGDAAGSQVVLIELYHFIVEYSRKNPDFPNRVRKQLIKLPKFVEYLN